MPDLVKRLREAADLNNDSTFKALSLLALEAANEIERLRTALKKAKDLTCPSS